MRIIVGMKNDIVCIYHKDCVDGTTAAAVLLKKFPHARAFPLAHGYTKEDIDEILDVTSVEAHIYIVDSVLGLAEFVERGNQVTILDHHISVYEETKTFVADHPNATYHFDNAKSGASLTWSYLFPEEPVLELVRLVEDNDLWIRAFGDATQHVVNYLSLLRNDPQRVCLLLDTDIEIIKKNGEQLTAYIHSEVERAVLSEPIFVTIGAYEVPVFNITNHQSACGNILSTKLDAAVGMYSVSGNEVRLSFRSLSHQTPSALTLAEILGGGGHQNASGARVELSVFVNHIVH